MTVGKRPQILANETAKDFAYIDGLMKPASHHRCRLGPGARKGLVLVRQRMIPCSLPATRKKRLSLHSAGAAPGASLAWVETIDVEQALCEYSKYEAYVTTGISAGSDSSRAERSERAIHASSARLSRCGGSTRAALLYLKPDG